MTNAKEEYYKNVFNKIVYSTDFDVRKTQHGINDPRVQLAIILANDYKRDASSVTCRAGQFVQAKVSN